MRYFTRAAVQGAALGAMVALSGCAGLTEASNRPDAPYQVAGPVVRRPVTPAVTLSYDCDGAVSGFVNSCDGFARALYP